MTAPSPVLTWTSVACCLLLGAYNLILGTWYNLSAGGIALLVAGFSAGAWLASQRWQQAFDGLDRRVDVLTAHQSSGLSLQENAVVAALHFRETIKKMHAAGEFPPGLQFEFPEVTVKSNNREEARD
jgi:hypothetical protein